MVKMCKYHSDKRCFNGSCSIFDRLSGNVSACSLFEGGDFLLLENSALTVVLFLISVVRWAGVRGLVCFERRYFV